MATHINLSMDIQLMATVEADYILIIFEKGMVPV